MKINRKIQNIALISISGLALIGLIIGSFLDQKITGKMGNYDNLTIASKIIFIINMLVGRLELIPFMVMLQKDFWSGQEIVQW